jgi:hypothetical protein
LTDCFAQHLNFIDKKIVLLWIAMFMLGGLMWLTSGRTEVGLSLLGFGLVMLILYLAYHRKSQSRAPMADPRNPRLK